MKKIVFVALSSLIIIGIVWLGYDLYRKVYRPCPASGQPQVVHIESGTPVDRMADILYSRRIIASAAYFKLYYRLFFSDLVLKSGDFLFEIPLTMKQVIMKLNEGRVILYNITIKEGLTIQEIADYLHELDLVKADEFLQASRTKKLIADLDPQAQDLEGYLYPDTYAVPKDITALRLVQLMVSRFRENFSNSLAWRARDIKFSIRDTVTLASLIEKETANRDERFLISSVFHNRLKRRMLLDCDPTIIYALKKENRYLGKLTWDDLKVDSPYNTRIYPGLPPGPICNPGLLSIEAALYPESTHYLFFVAKSPSAHHFSATLKEHNRAVREYIIEK